MAWPADWTEGEVMTPTRLKQWTDAQQSWPGNVNAAGFSLTALGGLTPVSNPLIYTGWGFQIRATAGSGEFGQLQILGGAAADSRAWRIASDSSGLLKIESASDNMVTTATRITIDRNGRVGIAKTNPNCNFAVSGLPSFTNNAAATAASLTAGDFYIETGSDPRKVCVVF